MTTFWAVEHLNAIEHIRPSLFAVCICPVITESSLGSRGDSYNNALAETINSLYKQDGADLQGAMEKLGIGGAGHAGMGVMAQPSTLARIYRLFPAHRSCGHNTTVSQYEFCQRYLNQTAFTKFGAIHMRPQGVDLASIFRVSCAA